MVPEAAEFCLIERFFLVRIDKDGQETIDKGQKKIPVLLPELVELVPQPGREARLADRAADAFGIEPVVGSGRRDDVFLDHDRAHVLYALHLDRKSTRLNSSHYQQSRMPSSA